MNNAPQFLTALPKRRYRLGEFEAVVLGDVESNDGKHYIYVFALVREGRNEPCLYVALERARSGAHHMVVTAEEQSKRFAASDDLADIEMFTEAALDAAVRLFSLGDEEPYRVM